MTKTFLRYLFSAALGLLGLSGSTVLAHHGVTGRYDAAIPIVLAGTVARATFSPPHPILAVRVEEAEVPELAIDRLDEFTGPLVVRAEDVGEVREIEFSPNRLFYDLGERLTVGDRVVVLALRNCLPPHQLRSTWMQLSDGEVLSYEGDWAPTVDGC